MEYGIIEYTEYIEFDIENNYEQDRQFFQEKLDMICPKIDTDKSIKNMLGWE